VALLSVAEALALVLADAVPLPAELAALVDADDFLRKTKARRDLAYDRLVGILNAPEFRATILDLVAWAETGSWRGEGPASEAMAAYARRKLAKRCVSFSEVGSQRHRFLEARPRLLEAPKPLQLGPEEKIHLGGVGKPLCRLFGGLESLRVSPSFTISLHQK